MAGGHCRFCLWIFVVTLLSGLIASIVVAAGLHGKHPALLSSPIAETPMICVYPISGQYEFLPRLLYYVLLVFGLTFRHHQWLVAGSLAASLTYAGSSAVHSILLAGFRHEPAYDLDLIPCAAILGAGVCLGIPLLQYSQSRRGTRAKYVIVLWLLLTSIGLICAVVGLWTPRQVEPPCTNPQGDLLRFPHEYALDAQFNCTYTCFSSSNSNHFRDLASIRAMPLHRLNSPISIKVFSAGFTVLVGTYTYGLSLLRSCSSPSPPDTKPDPWARATAALFIALTALLFLSNFIVSEVNLHLSPKLPTSEPIQAVDQWAPWVVVALIVAAALVGGRNGVTSREEHDANRRDDLRPSFPVGAGVADGADALFTKAGGGRASQITRPHVNVAKVDVEAAMSGDVADQLV